MSPVKLERKIVPKHLLTLNQKWHYYLLGSAKFNVSIQQYLKFTIIEWLGSSLEIRIKDINYFTVRVCHYHWTAGRWPPDLTFEPSGLTSGPSGLVFYWPRLTPSTCYGPPWPNLRSAIESLYLRNNNRPQLLLKAQNLVTISAISKIAFNVGRLKHSLAQVGHSLSKLN